MPNEEYQCHCGDDCTETRCKNPGEVDPFETYHEEQPETESDNDLYSYWRE